MTSKVHTLKGLRIHEVSLVDSPANPGAVTLLYKRKEPAVAVADKTKPAQKAASEGALDRLLTRLGIVKRTPAPALDPDTYADAATTSIDKATAALTTSIASILADATVTDKDAAVKKSMAEFRAYLGESVTDQIEKAMGDVALAAGEPVVEKRETVMPTPEEQIATLTKQVGTLMIEVAKAKMSPKHAAFMADGNLNDDEKSKFAACSPEDRDAMMAKKVKKVDEPGVSGDALVALTKAQSEVVDLQKRIAVFEADKEIADFRKRATSVGLVESQAETLMKASKGDPEAFGKVLEMIKASNAQARSALIFKEFGAVGPAAAGSARAEVEAQAEVLHKADPKLSLIAARVQVRKANIELAQRERDEERAGIRQVS